MKELSDEQIEKIISLLKKALHFLKSRGFGVMRKRPKLLRKTNAKVVY